MKIIKKTKNIIMCSMHCLFHANMRDVNMISLLSDRSNIEHILDYTLHRKLEINSIRKGEGYTSRH